MPRISFTPHLQRFLDAPPASVEGATVRDALDGVFAANPRLRGHVLDEHGRVRQHVAVFVGDAPLRTRDSGRTFEVLDRGLPAPSYDLVSRHVLDVDASGSVLAMGSTSGSLWISADSGDSWTCVSAHVPPIDAVRFGRQE